MRIEVGADYHIWIEKYVIIGIELFCIGYSYSIESVIWWWDLSKFKMGFWAKIEDKQVWVSLSNKIVGLDIEACSDLYCD